MQEVTLKDSGITVKIKKVSPLLFIELRKQFPPPKPPKNEVTGLDGKKSWEENPANPDYLEALEKYNEELEEHSKNLMLRRGVEVAVDKAAVEEVKAFWKDVTGKELSGDDRDIYIRYVVIQSLEDFEQIYSYIMEKSQPTEEDINAAKQAFKS